MSKNGINPKACFGNEIRSKMRGIIPQKIKGALKAPLNLITHVTHKYKFQKSINIVY